MTHAEQPAGRRPHEQPLPGPGRGPIIHEQVIQDLRSRLQVGVATYGQPLRAHNGRDALQDLYEEVLDAAVYLKQMLCERADQNAGDLDAVLATVRAWGDDHLDAVPSAFTEELVARIREQRETLLP